MQYGFGRTLTRCRLFLVAGLLLITVSPAGAQEARPLNILETPAGTRFGVLGPKPAKPAPTLFVFATGVDDLAKSRIYAETGLQLEADGWITVTVDIPCHGKDAREGEPGGIAGWAHRQQAGEDWIGPFTKRCSDALDYLIAEGYTDPARVALSGTSRGGFCALQFAAADSRVRAATLVSPVTNLRALREFANLTDEQVTAVNAVAVADKVTGRAIWISIGNDDERVSTNDCISTTQALVRAARAKSPAPSVLPIELLVGPSEGHRAVDDAYELAAVFLRKHCAAPVPAKP